MGEDDEDDDGTGARGGGGTAGSMRTSIGRSLHARRASVGTASQITSRHRQWRTCRRVRATWAMRRIAHRAHSRRCRRRLCSCRPSVAAPLRRIFFRSKRERVVRIGKPKQHSSHTLLHVLQLPTVEKKNVFKLSRKYLSADKTFESSVSRSRAPKTKLCWLDSNMLQVLVDGCDIPLAATQAARKYNRFSFFVFAVHRNASVTQHTKQHRQQTTEER